MLWARCLVLSSTALQAQLLLYHTEPFQFVDIGSTALILCRSTETIFSGEYFSWYKRRENEIPVLVKDCSDNGSSTKFVCRYKQQELILETSKVETEDSGEYFCATNYPEFSCSNGSSLIVGDSYTPSTRVMLLLPPPHLTQAGQVACVVHGVSNLVQVSWELHGELRPEALTRMVKNSSSLLTFASVLRIPTDSQLGGKNLTCEARFNSSGPSVKELATFPAPLSVDSDGKCLSYLVPTVVAGLLALLMLLLTFLWIRRCPSRLGFQHQVHEPPSSEALEEEGVCYAHLDFPSRPRDGKKKKRKQGSRGEKLKI